MNEELDRAAMLLHVVKEIAGFPKYANIMNAALAELDKINEMIVQPRSEPEPEAPAVDRRV